LYSQRGPDSRSRENELAAAVWGGAVVEGPTSRVNISALRKALGDGEDGNRYVANIPRRGYSFVAPVTVAKGFESVVPSTNQDRPNNLPQRLTKVIGRADTISSLANQLSEHRCITITGVGGIGKTTVALQVAEKLLGFYRDGVRLVHLRPVRDPSLVPNALATVVHTELRTEDAIPDLLASLRESQVLLVFDSCEHVIEAVAELTVAILTPCPKVHSRSKAGGLPSKL
jgi:hypothetical protein